MEFGPYGRGPRPQPFGTEMEHERERDLEEQAAEEHEAREVVARHRPWWAFWRRRTERG
jgi:hypothetical protein